MTGERWKAIEQIYHGALELPAPERAAFIRRAAGDDTTLIDEVETLLTYDEQPAAFMRHSALDLTARAVAQEAGSGAAAEYPASIGSYEILEPLGAGGMGDVLLARDRRLARKVALKLLQPGLTGPDWVAALRREALAASALNHPSIVTIYEIGEHEGMSFIAAEYVDGVTLRKRLKAGPIPVLELVDIALQIADGLAAAHDAGVVHRDVKPENIMLRADGLVKILDFGIATMAGSGPDGVVAGTTGYMSPEQLAGLPVDARTDVWSLGIVIAEMAIGRRPAAALDELAHLPALARVVGRAVSQNREDRYATARELAGDLRAVRRTLEGRHGSRKPWRLAAAAILVPAIAYSVVVAWRGSQPSTVDTDATRDPAAYQLYAKGRYHVLKRTPEDIQKGLEYLTEAVARDPGYAAAFAKLADAHILRAMTSDVAPKDSFPHAKAAAERALAIDPNLSEARVSMGIIKFWFDWDWSGAEAEFRRAIAADQKDPAAHSFYGHLLSNLGDHTRAQQEMRRALDYEPHSALANALFAQSLYYAGRHDDALAHLQKTLDLDPALWLTHNMIGRIHGLKGMHDKALAAFDRATELGGSLIVRANAGYTLAAAGRRTEARAILDQLRARSAVAYVPASNLALVHLGLGEHDKALDRLEEAADARDLLLTFLTVEPRWAGLAGHPRFTALLARIGLRQ
jgi:serine/threonine protein kinase